MALLDIFKKKKAKEKTDREKTSTLLGAGVPTSDTERQSVGKESKKDEKTSVAPKAKAKPVAVKKKTPKNKREIFSHVILRPRITEKASLQSGGNSYTFDVAVNTNKIEIKRAIQEIYGVYPAKVNVIKMKPKKKIVRGIKGQAPSFKKAVVFLKDEDSIEFV